MKDKILIEKSYDYPVLSQVHYIRFGPIPQNNNVSINWSSMKKEKGVSVYRSWFDPIVKKYIIQNDEEEDEYGNIIGTLDSFKSGNQKAYLLDGDVIGRGSDGEILLNSKTIKVIKEISRKDIVSEEELDIDFTGRTLEKKEIPDYDNETSMDVPSYLEGFNLPKIEIKPEVIERDFFKNDISSKFDIEHFKGLKTEKDKFDYVNSLSSYEKFTKKMNVYKIFIDGVLFPGRDFLTLDDAKKKVKSIIRSEVESYRLRDKDDNI